jgi:lysozyme
MRISTPGLELIKDHEKFKAQAYVAPEGQLTIGYGHVILPHEEHLKTATLTEDDALEILRGDTAIAEDAVTRAVKVELNQNQFDALVSFTFNTGGGALRNSTLVRLLNAGDYNGAAGQFDKWVYATVNGSKVKLGGLVRRRADERDLFLLPYLKPIAESRTIWGGVATAASAVAIEASDHIATVVPALEPLATSDWTKTVLFCVALLGAALVIYARLDDRKKGRR